MLIETAMNNEKGGIGDLGDVPVDRYQGQKAGQTTLPAKCLCQIPSHFVIEMCRRGWILRNEIIWHKPNWVRSAIIDFSKWAVRTIRNDLLLNARRLIRLISARRDGRGMEAAVRSTNTSSFT
jgi:hypothetical protein